ncbi:MAG: hypothetical protein ACFB13_04180 [Kiloniellaceae bacterium]
MKLNANQIAAVKQDLSAEPLEEQNPAMASLRQAFGDHTFYVGAEGLFVVEPVEDEAHPGEPAQLVLVAAWADDDKKALQPVPPQQTETVVDLATAVNGKGNDA